MDNNSRFVVRYLSFDCFLKSQLMPVSLGITSNNLFNLQFICKLVTVHQSDAWNSVDFTIRHKCVLSLWNFVAFSSLGSAYIITDRSGIPLPVFSFHDDRGSLNFTSFIWSANVPSATRQTIVPNFSHHRLQTSSWLSPGNKVNCWRSEP